MELYSEITSKAVFFDLTIHRFGINRKVRQKDANPLIREEAEEKKEGVPEGQMALPTIPATVNGNGKKLDKSRVALNKTLLVSPELKKIESLDGKIRRYLGQMCLPFKEGVYLLPTRLVDLVYNRIDAFNVERKALVNGFLAVYDKQKEISKKDLGPLYNEADYPSVEEVAKVFYITKKIWVLTSPDTREGISDEILKKEKEEAKKEAEILLSEYKSILRMEMQELINNLIERLASKEDGSRQKFKDATFRNIMDWLELFGPRNDIVNDEKLSSIVEEAKNILTGVTPSGVRSDDKLRENIREQFQKVKEQIDALPIDSFDDGGRMLDL